MGSWFVNYFVSKNAQISVYDVDRCALKFSPSSVEVAEDLDGCVKNADLALICVPVRDTPAIIKQCAIHMKRGAALGEIASIKHRTFPALAKIRRELVPLCIHPMFGPGATERKQLRILLVPVWNKSAELNKALEFFDDIMLVPIPSASAHDQAIGVVLGLTYFMNFTLANLLLKHDSDLIQEIKGTTFRLQSILAESILTDDPDLVTTLIRDNPYTVKIIKQYLNIGNDLARLASKDRSKLETKVRKVRTRMLDKKDVQNSYNLLYRSIKALDG